MKTKLSEKRLTRYVLAGGLSYAVELAVLLTLHRFGRLSAEGATAIAFWVGLLVSFMLQKLFAFRDYQKTLQAITHQMVGYGLLVLFNYTFTLFVVALFPEKLLLISRTIALVITTAWNYVFYKVIFHANPIAHLTEIASEARDWADNRFPIIRSKPAFFILTTIPIIAFFYQYLSSGSKLIVGDFDYYTQMYEAFRISVLHYHQIPLWNPWMSGGVPLLANPQFGLVSIQSLLVLAFGAVYGLKLAYVIYAIAGFWGMYTLCSRVVGSSVLRSISIGYIWIFCGFFAGHGISHFTFTPFFLMPWLFYFIAQRGRKWSWLWLGLLESLIILSSIHYAFLMTTFLVVLFAFLSFFKRSASSLRFPWRPSRNDILFAVKALGIVILLASYRFIFTYYFVSQNPKVPALLVDKPNPAAVLLEALFLPVGSNVSVPAHLQWGWGEYSMFTGIGVSLAILVCIGSVAYELLRKKTFPRPLNPSFTLSILILGLLAFGLALGDFSRFAPYHILRLLPGFSDTRVAARWLFFTMFSLLILLAGWRRNRVAINLLLLLSAVELFTLFGPPKITGANEVTTPPAQFTPTFVQYDNGRHHMDADKTPLHFYTYSTSRNMGQIYSDDSVIDTLDGVYNTGRCGQNINPACTFVLSKNAVVIYWSPNRITLKRTAPGEIELNMNVERGWRVNNTYPFASIRGLNPEHRFVLPDDSTSYDLKYSPKFSPSWAAWRLSKI